MFGLSDVANVTVVPDMIAERGGVEKVKNSGSYGTSVEYVKLDRLETMSSVPRESIFRDHMDVYTSQPSLKTEYDPALQQMNTRLAQSIGVSLDDYIMQTIVDKVLKEATVKPMMTHKCNGCGATVKMDISKHIFWCEYCGRTYAIGTTMLNDRG